MGGHFHWWGDFRSVEFFLPLGSQAKGRGGGGWGFGVSSTTHQTHHLLGCRRFQRKILEKIIDRLEEQLILSADLMFTSYLMLIKVLAVNISSSTSCEGWIKRSGVKINTSVRPWGDGPFINFLEKLVERENMPTLLSSVSVLPGYSSTLVDLCWVWTCDTWYSKPPERLQNCQTSQSRGTVGLQNGGGRTYVSLWTFSGVFMETDVLSTFIGGFI